MFEWGWQEGTATVVARRLIKEWRSAQTAHSRGGKRRKFEFILDVRPADGSPRFRATCENSWHDPVQGDEVPVQYKPKSQKVRFDKDRIRPNYGPRKPQPRDARWHDMLDDEPGSAPPPRNDS
ncbi:hypothetical protein [Nocardioides pelophilus]|uniref:hypothetical protein n=1 Tax=Nocardioides pelophilus TaxID=2172019 RepID=UPI0015FF4580|nr:hypothetical protein [Nocardioides pelophilus]